MARGGRRKRRLPGERGPAAPGGRHGARGPARPALGQRGGGRVGVEPRLPPVRGARPGVRGEGGLSPRLTRCPLRFPSGVLQSQRHQRPPPRPGDLQQPARHGRHRLRPHAGAPAATPCPALRRVLRQAPQPKGGSRVLGCKAMDTACQQYLRSLAVQLACTAPPTPQKPLVGCTRLS